MSTVLSLAIASGLMFLLSLGIIVLANAMSKALVASYLTMIGGLVFFAHSMIYDLSTTGSSFDVTAVMTYFPTRREIAAEYYFPRSDPRLQVENALIRHVNVGKEIDRLGLDIVARDLVVASTLGFIASEMGWWERERSDNDGEVTAVNHWYGRASRMISVAQLEGMLRDQGNVFSDFDHTIGPLHAPPMSRMLVARSGLNIHNDHYSLSIDVGEAIGHDQLKDGTTRLSLPMTLSYKMFRLRSQASGAERYRRWLHESGDKLRNWFAITF